MMTRIRLAGSKLHGTTRYLGLFISLFMGLFILTLGLVPAHAQNFVSGEAGQTGPNGGKGSLGGPGGFRGGNGQILADNPPAGAGMGPGGGGGAQNGGTGGGGSFATFGSDGSASAGNIYGTFMLLPLIGGSGGGGGGSDVTPGGSQDIGDGGGGGAIRLMANTISGAGTLDARGGDNGFTGDGFIRLEAFTLTFTGSKLGMATTSVAGLVFPPSIPTVQITQVDGTAVPAILFGGFGGIDLTLAAGTLAIDLEAAQVPLGTMIAVTAKPETDGDVIGPVISPALAGTLDSSTATVNLDFPTGGVYFLEARATFAVP